MSASDFISGQLTERKAIGRLIAFYTARSAYRAAKAPWWNIRQHARLRWTTACLTTLLDAIEGGDQHEEAAQWMGDWTGDKLDQAIIEAMAAYQAKPPVHEGSAA